MICPKCSREMGSDASVCPYCGFTFQTPKQGDETYTAPYASTPFSSTMPGASYSSPTPRQVPPPPPYQASYQAFINQTQNEPLSIGQYIGMILLTCIPVVGLILMIVWAAGKNTNANRRHFAAAVLILKAFVLLFMLEACIFFFIYHTPLFLYFYR